MPRSGCPERKRQRRQGSCCPVQIHRTPALFTAGRAGASLRPRLYETTLSWETHQDPTLDDSLPEWAALWKPLPKAVFSTMLTEVQDNARFASGGLAEEIERYRAPVPPRRRTATAVPG